MTKTAPASSLIPSVPSFAPKRGVVLPLELSAARKGGGYTPATAFKSGKQSAAEQRERGVAIGLANLMVLETLVWQRALDGRTLENPRSTGSAVAVQTLLPHCRTVSPPAHLLNDKQTKAFRERLHSLELACAATKSWVTFLVGSDITSLNLNLGITAARTMRDLMVGTHHLFISVVKGGEANLISSRGIRFAMSVVDDPRSAAKQAVAGPALLLTTKPLIRRA